MTEDSTPEQPEPEEQQSGKGIGCLYGGVAVIASSIIGGILAGLIGAVAGSVGVLLGVVLPIGILVAAGIRWRYVPGFLLGIGLTFALWITIFTACAALILVASS